MFKAILYYILFLGITMLTGLIGVTAFSFLLNVKHPFVAGFEDGVNQREYHYSYNTGTYDITPLEHFMNGSSIYMILFSLLLLAIVVFIFLRRKFAKLSWGDIKIEGIKKTVLITAMPLLGLNILVHAIGKICGLPVQAEEYMDRTALGDILLSDIDSITFAIVFFGAIVRELQACGKRPWVIFLTYFIMMLPFSEIVNSDDSNYIAIAIAMDLINGFYLTWLYLRTRSLNLVCIVGILSYLMPFTFYTDATKWVFCLLGALLAIYGFCHLKQTLIETTEPSEKKREYFPSL